jgi:hypothetical protein
MQKKGIFLFGTRNAISKVAPFNFTAMKRLNAIQSKNLNFLKFLIISLLFVFLAGQTQSIIKTFGMNYITTKVLFQKFL